MSIGQRITDLRKQQNLSQGALADRLDVSRQAVSKWENDLSSPDTAKLIELAEVLHTEVQYLATGVMPVYEHPVVVNMVEKVDKVVEKPVIRRVTKVQYVRNPMEYAVTGGICFLLGLLVGWIL